MHINLGTCLIRRMPSNHEFVVVPRPRISHAGPLGEQSDEFSFGLLDFHFVGWLARQSLICKDSNDFDSLNFVRIFDLGDFDFE